MAHAYDRQYPAQSQIAVSGGGAAALRPLGDPELYDELAANPEPAGFPVKRFDHSGREVDVDPALFQRGAADPSEVQVACHVFAVVKLAIELFSPHTVLPPPSGTGAQR